MGRCEISYPLEIQAHPEGRTSERRTTQPTDSKSVRWISIQYHGVLLRPSSLVRRGIFVHTVHCVHAVSQILHRNCTGNIKGKATRILTVPNSATRAFRTVPIPLGSIFCASNEWARQQAYQIARQGCIGI